MGRPNLCRENLRKYSETVSVNKSILFWFGFFAGFSFVFIMVLLVIKSEGNVSKEQGQGFPKVFPIFR